MVALAPAPHPDPDPQAHPGPHAVAAGARPRTADVVVVGAGPAGTAAAITLARAGRDVVVIDRARFPRDKCCGDGLTTVALRMLEELGLDPGRVRSWRDVDDVVVRSPGGRSFHFPLPRTGGSFAAVARRRDLDAELVALARAAGATVLEGLALTGVDGGDDRITVAVAGDAPGRIAARYAIGADGAWSPLRKLMGAAVPGYRGDWHAFRQYVTGVGPAARDRLHVLFEPDILPGYFWSFPVGDGGANIGFGIRRQPGVPVGAMKDTWPALLARPHIRALLGDDARPEGPHRAWPIPARIGRLPLACGRALFVGDAAAATDPLTGEGIGQALETGRWAARALIEAGPSEPAVAARRYSARVHRNLVVDHRLAGQLARLLARPGGVRLALSLAGGTEWTRRNFARWLFEDYPRAVVATPGRWHRQVFHGRGAYAP
jgi:geranylgeranyl reductase family protein